MSNGSDRGAAGGPAVLLLGIGNVLRGDDGVGPAAVRALAAAGLPPGVAVAESEGTADRLMALWEGVPAVVAVDAAAGGEPGRLLRFDAAEGLPAGGLRPSTHAFGLAEAVGLARALGDLPPVFIVHAVVGGRFEPGEGLSPPVAAALDRLVPLLREELERLDA